MLEFFLVTVQKRSVTIMVLFNLCETVCVGGDGQGQFIAEYVGDLIDEHEAQRRLTEAYRNNISNFYMMTLDGSR